MPRTCRPGATTNTTNPGTTICGTTRGGSTCRTRRPRPPTSGIRTPAGGEDWYWFDYGNVRFIAYPEPWSGAWANWYASADAVMAQADSDPAIRFIVTFGH